MSTYFEVRENQISLGRYTTYDQLDQVGQILAERYGLKGRWHELFIPSTGIHLEIYTHRGSYSNTYSKAVTGAFFIFKRDKIIKRGIKAVNNEFDLIKLDGKMSEINTLYYKSSRLTK